MDIYIKYIQICPYLCTKPLKINFINLTQYPKIKLEYVCSLSIFVLSTTENIQESITCLFGEGT